MGVLPTCLSEYYMCVWCPQTAKRGHWVPPDLKVPMVVSCSVGAGN